jgi:hypothetical protein
VAERQSDRASPMSSSLALTRVFSLQSGPRRIFWGRPPSGQFFLVAVSHEQQTPLNFFARRGV